MEFVCWEFKFFCAPYRQADMLIDLLHMSEIVEVQSNLEVVMESF